RVLGQYDLALLEEEPVAPPRLLLLAPNLAIAARNLSVDRDELVLWVAIHEITHAVQFTGAPWLRKHIGGMLQELIDGLQVSLGGSSSPNGDGGADNDRARDGGPNDGMGKGWRDSDWRDRIKIPDPAELRQLVERARQGELLRLTLGEERW